MTNLIDALPPHLAERTRRLNQAAPRPDAGFVLYWLRTACRTDENPALDAAIALGNRLGTPVFVHHALFEDAPYASDRHHTFVLDAVPGLARDMAARGVDYACHVERPGQRGPWLERLAARAAAVVTEDMPVAPWSGWTGRLAADAGVPVLAVDAACIVPMRLVDRGHDRAFAYRKATKALRDARLAADWPRIAPAEPPVQPELPYAPVTVTPQTIPDLVAACAIDHGVAPVPQTRGGGDAAMARWAAFRDTRLAAYADRRNDALDPQAVSRLSPYLHWGMMSPFRVAREAVRIGGRGAEKFLDELLIWREMGYAWCFHHPGGQGWDAVPDWARESLARREADRRPALLSWETLARGHTGDPLWDAAQASLRIHGELHNNLRMTWGKQVLSWTPTGRAALETIIDLNDRYALDGGDPNSVTGLTWCVGGFDRPFPPEQPITGLVRPRSTAAHARRLDPRAYGSAVVGRSGLRRPPRVAVIGAGVAGLACARTLHDHAVPVQVFDKGRGPGGRLATRRVEPFAFDHGAQYFTARDPRFGMFVDSWQADGLVARWPQRVARLTRDGLAVPAAEETRRFVAVPGMSALAHHLAQDLAVQCGRTISRIERRDDGHWLHVAGADGPEAGPFDVVLVTVPAPQVPALLTAAPRLVRRATAATYRSTLAAMLGFDRALDLDYDAVSVDDGSPLAWIARDRAKPGRPRGEAWVVHAGAEWSARHLESGKEEIAAVLAGAFAAATGVAVSPVHAVGHRWRYAFVTEPLGEDCLYDPDTGLGLAGDWCLGPRIEAAWLSGCALAGRVLGQATAQERTARTRTRRRTD